MPVLSGKAIIIRHIPSDPLVCYLNFDRQRCTSPNRADIYIFVHLIVPTRRIRRHVSLADTHYIIFLIIRKEKNKKRTYKNVLSIFCLFYRSLATAMAAPATACTSSAALPPAQLTELTANDQKHNDCQHSNNNNIRHFIHPSIYFTCDINILCR